MQTVARRYLLKLQHFGYVKRWAVVLANTSRVTAELVVFRRGQGSACRSALPAKNQRSLGGAQFFYRICS